MDHRAEDHVVGARLRPCEAGALAMASAPTIGRRAKPRVAEEIGYRQVPYAPLRPYEPRTGGMARMSDHAAGGNACIR
ncbi:MAG: hypothetical protein HYR71_04340 [Chloroflexi bacterium]|nr:hypothetical protein [Chloroflexota bacterium]